MRRRSEDAPFEAFGGTETRSGDIDHDRSHWRGMMVPNAKMCRVTLTGMADLSLPTVGDCSLARLAHASEGDDHRSGRPEVRHSDSPRHRALHSPSLPPATERRCGTPVREAACRG